MVFARTFGAAAQGKYMLTLYERKFERKAIDGRAMGGGLQRSGGTSPRRNAIRDLCSSMSILSQAAENSGTFLTRKRTRTIPSPVGKRSLRFWEQRPSEAADYVTVMVPMLSPCKKNDLTNKKA